MSRGPYIVTTHRPYVRRPYSEHDEFLKPVSRLAVATLEADETALRMFGVRPGHHDEMTDEQAQIVNRLARLPECGGTVWLLGDETEVEAEPTTYDDLIATGLECPAHVHPHGWGMAPSHIRRPAILDAYNARRF